MPNTKKNTSNVSSLADALNVCMRIFRPDECRVNLNNLMIRIIEKNSSMSAFSMFGMTFCSIKSQLLFFFVVVVVIDVVVKKRKRENET
jgi:hypothetical protein